jgi:hypothetical protein
MFATRSGRKNQTQKAAKALVPESRSRISGARLKVTMVDATIH